MARAIHTTRRGGHPSAESERPPDALADMSVDAFIVSVFGTPVRVIP